MVSDRDVAFFESKLSPKELELYMALQGRGKDRPFPLRGLTVDECIHVLNNNSVPHDPIVLVRWSWEKGRAEANKRVNNGETTWRKLYKEGYRWGIQGDITIITTVKQLRELIKNSPYDNDGRHYIKG